MIFTYPDLPSGARVTYRTTTANTTATGVRVLYLTGTTGRTADPLRHAVHRGQPNYRAWCGVRVRSLTVERFNPTHPRACPKCRKATV